MHSPRLKRTALVAATLAALTFACSPAQAQHGFRGGYHGYHGGYYRGGWGPASASGSAPTTTPGPIRS